MAFTEFFFLIIFNFKGRNKKIYYIWITYFILYTKLYLRIVKHSLIHKYLAKKNECKLNQINQISILSIFKKSFTSSDPVILFINLANPPFPFPITVSDHLNKDNLIIEVIVDDKKTSVNKE